MNAAAAILGREKEGWCWPCTAVIFADLVLVAWAGYAAWRVFHG